MRTLVLPPRFSPDSIAISRAAERAGWKVARLTNWRLSEELHGVGAAIYGEPLFAHVVAEPLGTALIEPAFDWLTTLPERYLRRSVRFATLAEARALKTRAFVKPADDKCFPAGVHEHGRAIPNAGDMTDGSPILPCDTPVLIATPVRWRIEYRCFIRDRVCRALSVYLREGELAIDESGDWRDDDAERAAAFEFIERLLADAAVDLPPAVVVDVGEIAESGNEITGGWAVIEANAAWGCGIYGCEPPEALNVVDRACVPIANLNEADRRWRRKP